MHGTTRFVGEYPATLDGEGRIQLPLALRDEMNVRSAEFRLMANLEPDGSLCLREHEGWEAYVDQLRSQPTASLRDRRTLLFLAANSAPVRCDKQGRIRIPDSLLEHAGIDRTQQGRKELVIVGNFDDLRVWHPDRWNAFGEEALADFGAGVDALIERGVTMREVDRETQ
jgi:transcriptional regulator MraZ